MACAVLVAIAAVVFTKDIFVGGFRWGDGSVHAMDGVLIHDWICAGPKAWLAPLSFAERQYAFYPILGIGRSYPPGFAAVEAVFFALFGISVPVARFCTATFGLAAIVGVYFVARRRCSAVGAACTAGFFLAIPSVVLWTRQVMLEMPTVAVLIWLMYAVQSYLAKSTWPRCVVVVLLMITSVLFKQTAIFIVPVVGIVMLVKARQGCVPWKHFMFAASLLAVTLGPMLLFTLWTGSSQTFLWETVKQGRPLSTWFSPDSLLFYPMTFPDQVGWIVLAAAAAGMIISLRRFDWESGYVLLWFVLFMFMVICIQLKLPRYVFFAYFPLAIWAGRTAEHVTARFRRKLVPSVTFSAMVLILVAQAHGRPVPCEPDWGDMVAAHADKIRGEIVFGEGRRDGDFIFAVRERLGPRQAVIVRGSKILYSCAGDTYWRYKSYVSSVEEVRGTLGKFGFSALFVERNNVTEAREIDLLQEYLDGATEFALVNSRVLTTREAGFPGRARTVGIYIPTAAGKRNVRFVDIPMPASSHKIRIDLDELTRELSSIERGTF